MALAQDDDESAEFGNAGTEPDVGSAACHIGYDGDDALLAGVGNDLRFRLVLRRAQDAVRHAERRKRCTRPVGLTHTAYCDERRKATRTKAGRRARRGRPQTVTIGINLALVACT